MLVVHKFDIVVINGVVATLVAMLEQCWNNSKQCCNALLC